MSAARVLVVFQSSPASFAVEVGRVPEFVKVFESSGCFVMGGIQHPDDARLAIDNGADVLYCANHGGRQANSAICTLQLLPGVVKAAGSTPVIFDSGVRSGTDAVIALALGATAVGIGRPYAYALSYGGAESLTHYLRSFLAELDLCLAVCGFKDIATLKEAGCEEAISARPLLPN